ncbi:MAG: RiPP maturation radical SAM C-methyltransferase [Thermodesulfobacteriota bacterium]
MPEVCLAAMPFSRPTGPSLALGLLQAILARGGVEAASVYGNLAFFAHVSYSQDVWIIACSRDQSLGDWIFAGAAFPDFAPDHDAYLELTHARNAIYRRLEPAAFKARAWDLRAKAARFVDELALRILERRPRVLGCSSTCVQQVASLALLRRARELDPALVTMLGGANCEGVMGLTVHRAFPWVDYVVSGEADDLILGLVRGALEKGRELAPEALAEGVFAPCHRRLGYPGDPADPPRAAAADLGRLPTPDYSDYFAALAESPALGQAVQPGLLVESSRGCWWGRCRFCSLDGRQCAFRSKPAGKVLDELDALARRHGATRFLFTDSLMNRRYFEDLLPALERAGAPYRLFIEIKSNLDRDELTALRRAGFTFLQPGIESFSSAHLAHMNKGVQAWQNLMVVKLCRQLGIGCVYNLLHALPGEQEAWIAEMAALAPLITHLRPPATVCQVRFDRLSHFARCQAQWGLELIPPPAFAAIYPVGPELAGGLAYSFVDREREAVAANPLLAAILLPAAVVELVRQVRRWRAAYYAPRPAMLCLRPNGEALLVSDTRPAAKTAANRLGGLERDLLLACDDAPRLDMLRSDFLGRGVDPLAWQAALEMLLDHGYAVELDGRLVGLALSEPVPAEPAWEEFGGGSLDLERLAGDQAAPDQGRVAG